MVGSSASGRSRSITLRHPFRRDRLDVGPVGDLGVGHDRRRIRVDQHDPVALLLERPHRLGARVVELRPLPDDDGPGADQENGREVSPFGHPPVPAASASSEIAAPSRSPHAACSDSPPDTGCRRAAISAGSGTGSRLDPDQLWRAGRTGRGQSDPRPAAMLYISPGPSLAEQGRGTRPTTSRTSRRSRTGSRLPVGTVACARAPCLRAAARRRPGRTNRVGWPGPVCGNGRATIDAEPVAAPDFERRHLATHLARRVGRLRPQRIRLHPRPGLAGPVDLAARDHQQDRGPPGIRRPPRQRLRQPRGAGGVHLPRQAGIAPRLACRGHRGQVDHRVGPHCQRRRRPTRPSVSSSGSRVTGAACHSATAGASLRTGGADPS